MIKRLYHSLSGDIKHPIGYLKNQGNKELCVQSHTGKNSSIMCVLLFNKMISILCLELYL